MFEASLKDNLYRLWNRMSSGSYFPPAVRLVEIPKKNGDVRTRGSRQWKIGSLTLARWARRKYKKLLRYEGRSLRWLWRVARRQPTLFTHWRAYGQAGGRAMEAV